MEFIALNEDEITSSIIPFHVTNPTKFQTAKHLLVHYGHIFKRVKEHEANILFHKLRATEEYNDNDLETRLDEMFRCIDEFRNCIFDYCENVYSAWANIENITITNLNQIEKESDVLRERVNEIREKMDDLTWMIINFVYWYYWFLIVFLFVYWFQMPPKEMLTSWLRYHLDSETFPGVCWLDRSNGMFKIPWSHQAHKKFSVKDFQVFICWGVHKNRIDSQCEMTNDLLATVKTNFRCALNASNEITSLPAYDKKGIGVNSYRVFKFIVSSDVLDAAVVLMDIHEKISAANALVFLGSNTWLCI